MRITIDELLREVETPRSDRENKALQELSETISVNESFPMTASDHDEKSRRLQSRADELKAGGKKDAYQTAADAHGKAARAIRAAIQCSDTASSFN
ncbi:MAG: hypothetical protein WBM24_08570 [Candidatus Sulfotelmatobacter sp.]